MNHIILQRTLFPWLKSDHLFRFSHLKKVSDECLEILHGFTNSVIKDKRREFLEQGDFTVRPKSKAIAFLDLVSGIFPPTSLYLNNDLLGQRFMEF